MALPIQQLHPVAHLPLVLGVVRRLEVATLRDGRLPPHPAPGRSGGRGGAAWVLAILDRPPALSKVGKRLDERGRRARLRPGLTRAALHAARLGHLLEALCAANLNPGERGVALTALEGSASATPGLHQDTPPRALYGAYEDAPQAPGAPRPAEGQSQDGRDDLTQGLLSWGVSGAGGGPLRLGMRDGKTRDRVETPGAIEEGLARGLAGVEGIVAESQAESRRP